MTEALKQLVLVELTLIPGYDSFKFVMHHDSIETYQKSGAKVVICEDQHMLSVIALRQIAAATGHQITLKAFERVTNFQVNEDLVTVVISVVDSRERPQGFEIRRIGDRIYGFRLINNTWMGQPALTVWDENFVPQFVRTHGRSVDLKAWWDALWFARECYRPGTSSNPMDNYQRTSDGAANEHMKTYWQVEEIGEEVGEL